MFLLPHILLNFAHWTQIYFCTDGSTKGFHWLLPVWGTSVIHSPCQTSQSSPLLSILWLDTMQTIMSPCYYCTRTGSSARWCSHYSTLQGFSSYFFFLLKTFRTMGTQDIHGWAPGDINVVVKHRMKFHRKKKKVFESSKFKTTVSAGHKSLSP